MQAESQLRPNQWRPANHSGSLPVTQARRFHPAAVVR